ncbi:MAG TPA: LysM domain-containing protein, partial [Anaerolineales bacterium]|nr:LysM domain-containing protein [Anaerolineales bacterium]
MKNKVLFVIIISLSLLWGQSVSAQDEAPTGPEYVVQSGDTLTAIAVRFGITLNELQSANNISNPNQVFVGDVLEIPGVDWVSGLLDVRDVPVGETFRSLRRRYQLEPAIMGRVGG